MQHVRAYSRPEGGIPGHAYDAKGLMYSALLGTDPVIFFESQRIYDQPELFHAGGVPIAAYEIPIGEPDVKKTGNDLTLLSIGATFTVQSMRPTSLNRSMASRAR